MATINEVEAERAHAAAMLELEKQRAAAAEKLARIDAQLAEVKAANFRANAGDLKVEQMTVREKVAAVNLLGVDGFTALVTAGRR